MAIADIKVDNINEWLKERMGEGRSIHKNPFVVPEARRLLLLSDGTRLIYTGTAAGSG